LSAATQSINKLPIWSWVAPIAAGLLVCAKFAHVVSVQSAVVAVLASVLLAGAIFASVHHAEIIAARIGQPFGTIVLAVAVTVIEASLIVSLMLSSGEGSGQTLARDTIYATIMIVLNGVIGMCLIFGGLRHYEQTYQRDASAAALSVLGTLCVITLVLPNYTHAVFGPIYSSPQLIFVAIVSTLLYCAFLFVQTVRHRNFFVSEGAVDDDHEVPTNRTTLISLALLCVALAAVVLLAKSLSPILEATVAAAQLPSSFVGVIIAGVVLLPEGIAAVRAARLNRLQTSLNIAFGSGMATIGLTIPIVSLTSLLVARPIALGLAPLELVLLILTLFISSLTLLNGRSTILQGCVHLVIFGVFLFLAAVP
jgi:Ca2+:H+ antiporter